MSTVVPTSTLNELADLYYMTMSGDDEATLAYDARLTETMEEHDISLLILDAQVRTHCHTTMYAEHQANMRAHLREARFAYNYLDR